MQQVYKTSELMPSDRDVVERLLGRSLLENESVMLVTQMLPDQASHAATAVRQQAAARLLEMARGKTVGGLSARDLIEEGRR